MPSASAVVALARDGENVEAYYRHSCSHSQGMRPQVAHCHFGLYKRHRRRGDREQAQEHLTTAIAIYRETGMTYWLEQTEAELRRLR